VTVTYPAEGFETPREFEYTAVTEGGEATRGTVKGAVAG
jgi:hypothetical protein